MSEQAVKSAQTAQETARDQEIKNMFECGIHYGHKRTIFHPSMKEYIFGIKDSIYIINLDKTYDKLEEALQVLAEYKKNNKVILVVSTLPHFRSLVVEFAEKFNFPFVANRWIGGLLTNFEVVKTRIKTYLDLRNAKKAGQWDALLKKERVKLEKKLEKLDKKWQSLATLTRVPDILFVFNVRGNLQAIREAKYRGAKIMAIADTDADISDIDYVIPANDNALNSVKYIISKIVNTLSKS